MHALHKKIKIYKQELHNKNKTFNKSIKINIIVKTPTATTITHHLAKKINFFSINTNNLTQYTLAIDHNNNMISHLYQPISPSVLNLIKQIINTSHAKNK